MLVYIQLYNIKLPAVSEMIMIEFQKLIEFHALNPEKLIQMLIDEDFTFAKWIKGIQ